MPPLRIAYLCDMDPRDRNIYSGGNARMFDALSEVAHVTPLAQDWGHAEALRQAILKTPTHVNLRARWRAHYAVRALAGRRVMQQLRGGDFDVLFCTYALQALAGVRVPDDMVMAFTSDAVQTVYRESEIGAAHADGGPGRLLDGWVEHRERAVLQQLDLALWPSDWIRGLVDDRYGLEPGVSHVVEWGANLPPMPPPGPRLLDGRVHLLVIGRDWFAKGGPMAFELLETLRAAGVDTRLTVIGCTPPDFHRNAHVTVHPQLDKAVPAELETFQTVLAEAHLLMMPSHESYGFAFCEASAHGLPALCLRVGGVPVYDGINGHALPAGSTAEDFAAIVHRYLADPEGYRALSRSSRAFYEERLNWQAWARRTVGHLEQALAAKRR